MARLVLLLIFTISASGAYAEKSSSKASRRVISLGELKIEGDIEKPTLSFVLPRASFDFLNQTNLFDKKNLKKDIVSSVEIGFFEVY